MIPLSGSPRVRETHARGEPFDSSLILSLSKDERLAQDRLVAFDAALFNAGRPPG